MLRMLDARSGCYAEVRSARPGMLLVSAHLRPGAKKPDWTGIRVLLIADLLARAAELRGIQVLTAAVFPGEPPEERTYAERAAGSLDIHPAAARVSSAEAPAVLGGPADVHITDPDTAHEQLSGLVTQAGVVRMRMMGSGENGPRADGPIPADADPLAMRLALMSHPHHRPVALDDSMLASARDMTARWRSQVADWAESPSRPMPPRVRRALDAAFGDLDIPRVQRLLTTLVREDDVPAGVKFETFAFADRVLSLELARQVGRPRL
ncbi:MAG TPA: hypothetical protein VMA72_00760 [Streptosporangiaceae bacterium]|nr:hypothetical protein [Streptosporangiaceae bacterium]